MINKCIEKIITIVTLPSCDKIEYKNKKKYFSPYYMSEGVY
jgi:hypothetical protein